MSTLIIRKKSLKTWLHTDSILGDFIISKFYFNADNGNFQVVEQGQSKRVIYDVTDITLYDDTDGGVAETFANITALSLRLEELNYPAFQYNGQIVSIANLIEAGTNVTITGDGTEASPYVISSSGGGGGAVDSVNGDTGAVIVDLQSATDEGNETTNDVIFRLDADKFIKVDSTNQVIQIFDLTIDAVNPIAYLNGTQISFIDGSGNSLEMSPTYFANYFSDNSFIQFFGALLTIADGGGSNSDLNPYTLQFNSSGSTTVYAKDKITVDLNEYNLPTGATSQIATLLDIPSPITIDATPTDGSSNAVSSNGVFDALATKVSKSDYTPAHSILVQQSGTGTPTALSVGNNTLVGRLSGGGSDINDLSVSDVRTLLSIDTDLALKANLATPTFSGVVTTPLLALTSTTNGLLPNALTSVERDAIVSPIAGTMIFNTTEGYPEYYDTFWGWMPLYASVEWKRKWGIEEFKDFGLNSFEDGTWGTLSLGSSFFAVNNSPGVLNLAIAAVASNARVLGVDHLFLGGGKATMGTKCRIFTLSTSGERYQFRAGFGDSATTINTVDGAYILYDEGGVSTGSTASPNWQIVTSNGSVRTFTTSSVAVTTGWHQFQVVVNANATSVEFFVDGVSLGTHNTNVPLGNTGVQNVNVKSVGSGTINLPCDFIYYKQKFTTARW